MFESATLASAPAGKRLWTTAAGFGGQAVFIGIALVTPLLFPQILPRATFTTVLLPPGPPRPLPPKGDPYVRPRTHIVPTQFDGSRLFAPVTVPATVAILNDPPPESTATGVPGGVAGGSEHGVAGGVLDSILREGAPPPAVPQILAPSQPPPAAASIAPKRVRQGGLVKPAQCIHRVEPVYPKIALQARIGGTVEIEGVIGTDGRMRELRVVSGHPLLVRAALEAVRQWIYQPTTLNGDPVEVIAPITVTFRLN